MAMIMTSYLNAKAFPIKPEKSLEDFFINRFGKKLYSIFFKDYTEKLWGVPCSEIKPEWGAQRVKGLSISKVIANIFKKKLAGDQKGVETSLIEQFLYPKFGPGQMWGEVARIIKERGGEIFLNYEAVGINSNGNKITGVSVKNKLTGEIIKKAGDYFFSTMPVKDLIMSFFPKPPEQVLKTAAGLIYRDFITAGILLKKLKNETFGASVSDNWIYIQERDVKMGRLQIFNNWSPYMVKDLNNAWLGLEYFCTEGDDLWKKSEEEFLEFAVNELARIKFIEKEDILERVVFKVEKAYPAYFGSYDNFHVIRNFTDKFENLFLIGRNGMHKYNNQDHSMMTAMTAVENIINGKSSKTNIWDVNTEKDYHESK
jgi:protoporphyrinogen oxidase